MAIWLTIQRDRGKKVTPTGFTRRQIMFFAIGTAAIVLLIVAFFIWSTVPFRPTEQEGPSRTLLTPAAVTPEAFEK